MFVLIRNEDLQHRCCTMEFVRIYCIDFNENKKKIRRNINMILLEENGEREFPGMISIVMHDE